MNKINKKIMQSIIIIGIIIVLIGIIYSESGETDVEFSLANTQHSCQYNAEGDVSFWVWWDGVNVIKEEIGIPIPPKSGCYFLGGWPSDGCCPDDIQCVADTGDPLFNQCNGFAPDICSDYNEYPDPEAYCKAFNINVAIRSVEKMTGIDGICSGDYSIPINITGKTNCNQYTSNCRCYWDDSGDGECKSTSTSYVFCGEEQIGNGTCTQKSVNKLDECSEKGLITYNWTAVWDMSGLPTPKPSWCADGIKTFSCNMIKLSFFTFMNILLCILIVVIIYYYKIVRGRRETTFP